MLRRGAFRDSATNLAHYLALREVDLRPVQKSLVAWGLTGLGRSESRVKPTLDAAIANLEMLCGEAGNGIVRPTVEEFWAGTEALKHATDALFGPTTDGRETRILVTMAAKAAKDADHVRELVRAGMNAARINCAHDGPKAWTNMIRNIRDAAAEHGRRCPILMDLQGPKIRTRTVLTPEEGNIVEAGDQILITFGEPEPRRTFPSRPAAPCRRC